MDEVQVDVQIECGIDHAFEVYVNHIDVWWPRRGAENRYSFAPEGQEGHIYLEAETGGRFYEVFADGTEFVIGRVLEYRPPHLISYTWRSPGWAADTTIVVGFTESGEGTLVTVRHFGFVDAGVPDMAEGYGFGWKEILEVFADAAAA